MNIYWYLSDVHAPGHVRGEVIAREINRNTANYTAIAKTDIMMSDMFRANICVYQRQYSTEALKRLELAKQRGIKSIYDIDDDMWNIPKEMEKVREFYTKPEVLDGFASFCTSADAITASTVPLGESLRERFGDSIPIFIVENGVDMSFYAESYMFHTMLKDRKDLIVGWFGSTSHKPDLTKFEKVMKRTISRVPNVKFSFAGNFDQEDLEEEYGDRVEFHGWLGYHELKNWLSCLDVGLCLLEDNQFNKCKSGIKWMQHAAVGVPCICSRSEPYKMVEDEQTGWLANGIDDENIPEMLQWLDGSREKISEIGNNARFEVEKNHNIEKKYLQWLTTFDRVIRM